MTKILITGANGQLGEELLRLFVERSPQFPVDIIGTTRTQLDLANPTNIKEVIAEIQPQVVINCAAYTAVDRAETEPDLAEAINSFAPGVLAEECVKLGAKLLHVSTDYVFDGQKGSPYLETDPTGAIGVYGQSKLEGEQAIMAVDTHATILRTAWVYGAGQTGNFVKTMLRLGAEREEVRVVADQIGSPSWTRHIAEAIADLATTHRELSGIFHFTNSGVASWYDFAVAIFEEAAILGFPLTLNKVLPITTADYPTPAARPAYSVLAGGKLAAARGVIAPHWRSGLRSMLIDFNQR